MSEVNDMTDAIGSETSKVNLAIAVLVGVGTVYWLVFRRWKQSKEENERIAQLRLVSSQLNKSNVNEALSGSTSTSSGSFVSKMKAAGRSMIVFYGSQTGTAEDFATRLAKEANRYGIKATACDPEECQMEDLSKLPAELPNSIAVFCVATYGEGDPTDNAQEFVRLLRDSTKDDLDLTGLRYAVFGLGNRTYEHFNAIGILVDKRLEELGATRVVPLGVGDDDQNIEDDFIVYKEQFWPAVCQSLGVDKAASSGAELRQYRIKMLPEARPEQVFTGEPARLGSYRTQKLPFDAKNPYLATIGAVRELHGADSDRSCLHIELDITGSSIRYESGDHVAVFPPNRKDLVDRLIAVLQARAGESPFDPDAVFTMDSIDPEATKKHPFPCPVTFRTALTYYVDLTSAPRTNVIADLAECCTDEADRTFLRDMTQSTPESKQKLAEWILRDGRNIVEVLEDIPSCKPAADLLCELLPRLQVRYYSISSSPQVHPKSIHITAVVVDYTTRIGRKHFGVATGYFKQIQQQMEEAQANGQQLQIRVPVYVRRSQFRLPYKSVTPIVMIGPGTGLAPFRGFIQERDHQKHSLQKPVGETVLYFGCRNRKVDYLYESELNEFASRGTITSLLVAFSRDQVEKVYVQHLMRREDNAKQLWRLLESGAHVYVCGDARRMARDVIETLEEVLLTYGNLPTRAAAQEYIKKLQSKGRYQADVWS